MEAALGLVGAVGVVGQIFDGCIKAYRIFTTAANLGRDSERLACRVRIEEARLQVWGREWGVIEGRLDVYLKSADWGPPDLSSLAEAILMELYTTIMSFSKLKERYGLGEASPGSVDKEAYKKSEDPRNSVAARLKEGLTLRARWVVVDKEKFEVLLEDLQYYNDRLEKLFPPERVVTLRRSWEHEILDAAPKVENLSLLETASGQRYPQLNTLAKLKHLRINLDGQEPSKKILSTSELKIQKWRVNLDSETPNADQSQKVSNLRGHPMPNRTQGVYQRPIDALKDGKVFEDVRVLVDFIPYEHYQEDLDSRLHLYQRIDNLARMLHSASNRHPDLHTLDCLGYFDDTAANRYALVHLTPSEPHAAPAADSSLPVRHFPLSALIDDNTRKTPDLDARFQLARSLAIALWSFHSLDWLHKAFCPSNILFFLPQAGGSQPLHHNLNNPFVLGFESSRPEHLSEMSAAPMPSSHMPDLYRHPDSLGVFRQKYQKAFDVYSLGLVLLEIGLWTSIRAYWKPKYSPTVFRQKIISGMVPALGAKTGSRYKNVVERCLRYGGSTQEVINPPVYDDKPEKSNPQSSASPNQVMEWVVMSLERLSV
ncbi:MAG: hypothetical protein M1820_000627 [Bogoriella megaspora]|nr:MAG: hypothetical protein M1820_000627 [Bogoriella megaspora]